VIRAALFDLDGTLADSEALIAEGIRYALVEHGYEVTRQQVLDILGPPMTEMVPMLVGPVAEDEYRSIRAAYDRNYHEVQLPNIPPLPGAVALLDELRARGVPLAVVTNKIERGAHEQITAMGWTDRFAAVIGADTAARSKPYADPALLALERLGVAPEDGAFVGDTGADMECATAAGIPVRIGIVRVRTQEAMRAAGATHCARDLAEAADVLLGATVPDA
jgi:phosphoglycolate phosphatase